MASRKEDMSPKGVLILSQQSDGDIVIQIVADDEYGSPNCVEFCTGAFGGGGGSPHTFEALNKLMEAIEMDNLENPSRAV